MCIIIYTNIYIVPLPVFYMEEEFRREAEEFFERYVTGIVETTAIFENGVLECESTLYNFEVTSDYVRAFDKKQEGKEVFYCSERFSKLFREQTLLDGLLAITHMLPELNAKPLEKIVSQATQVVQSGLMNENSSLNTTFDA
jgi:hypothetical protein